jgi:hypothetical protein
LVAEDRQALRRKWLHIWNELTQTAGHCLATVRTSETTHLHQLRKSTSRPCPRDHLRRRQHPLHPLQFWFCATLDSLPLIALQYHEVKINFEFRDASELVVFETPNFVIDGELARNSLCRLSISTRDERRRFAR